MKKNTLDTAIAELGIENGDVIKLTCDCGNDFYQYKDGKLFILGAQDLSLANETMGDDEVMELITGREFEIIAKGKDTRSYEYLNLHNKISCLEDGVVDSKFKLEEIDNKVNLLRDFAVEEKKEKDKRKEIGKWIDLGLIAFWAVFLVLFVILSACGVL